MLKRFLAASVALALSASPMVAHAFGDGTGFKTGTCEVKASALPGASGRVLEVGAGKAYDTIQKAVNATTGNDHIVIYPGVYKEQVVVRNKPGIRITGTDRNAVIIDGQNTRSFGIWVDHSDNTLIENLTARQHPGTSIYWLSSTGYWGRYLTVYNQGDYGIYAYDSRCGQLDHTYSSGAADGGIYIGECYPCDAVVTNIESTENGLGYSGTNAGGNLLLKDSWWHNNALGIVPNSLDGELAPPQRGITIKDNLVENNDNINAPGRGAASIFYGVGIAIAGGSSNHIIGNTVLDHKLAGIILSPLVTDSSLLYVPGGNAVYGNTVSGSGLADIAQGASSSANNCWSHNTYGTAAPPLLETVWACFNTDDDALPYTPGITPPGGDPRIEAGFAEAIACSEGDADACESLGLNARSKYVGNWRTWPAPTCAAHPNSCVQMPDENGDADYSNDGAPDIWLPALL